MQSANTPFVSKMATIASMIRESSMAKLLAQRDIIIEELYKDLESIGVDISSDDDADPIDPSVPLSSNQAENTQDSTKDNNLPTVEADFSAVKTSVWWDIENCEVPKGCDAHRIVQNISSVLSERNYCGSLIIYAYGDTTRIPFSVQHALSSTGVSLNHVPSGVKDGSDKKIIVDMMLWAMENQAPANLMLISGDGDFSYVLNRLAMKRYNILLARPEKASASLIASAKTVWLWTSIVTEDRPNTTTSDDGARQHLSYGSEVLSHLVPKQAQPNKPMDTYLARGTKRYRSFCGLCNVVCSNHDLTFHLSGKRHRTKIVKVAGEHPRVSNSTEPKSVFCGVCQIGYSSEAMYEIHILGSSHQNKLKDGDEHSHKKDPQLVSLIKLRVKENAIKR